MLCGKTCEELDPRHPDRWRPFSRCHTADRGSSQKTFKQVILETCDRRNDKWGNEVRLRVQGTVSDLHAADAQYHWDCLQSFKGKISHSQNEAGSEDGAFLEAVDCMLADKSHWTWCGGPERTSPHPPSWVPLLKNLMMVAVSFPPV